MKHTKKHRTKKDAWFVHARGSFLPGSRQGWLLYGLYVLYLIASIVYVLIRAVDYLDYVIMLPVFLGAGLVTMTWFAEHHS